MGNDKKLEVISFLINFCLKCFNFFFDFSLKYGQRNNCGEKKVWGGGHRIGFKIIPLFVLKIVLADTGYIEVQYTKIKSALANRSSACVTARNPAVRRQGRVRHGAVAVHLYDHVGSSPAWILLLRASLLNDSMQKIIGLKNGFYELPLAQTVKHKPANSNQHTADRPASVSAYVSRY